MRERQRQTMTNFSNSIQMPLFEEEFIAPEIGGWGHVRFGHSYSCTAGHVYILLGALAGICLAKARSLNALQERAPWFTRLADVGPRSTAAVTQRHANKQCRPFKAQWRPHSVANRHYLATAF